MPLVSVQAVVACRAVDDRERSGVPSERMTSKLALPVRMEVRVRHSITNCRFGATPRTAVKMPPPASSVRRSS